MASTDKDMGIRAQPKGQDSKSIRDYALSSWRKIMDGATPGAIGQATGDSGPTSALAKSAPPEPLQWPSSDPASKPLLASAPKSPMKWPETKVSAGEQDASGTAPDAPAPGIYHGPGSDEWVYEVMEDGTLRAGLPGREMITVDPTSGPGVAILGQLTGPTPTLKPGPKPAQKQLSVKTDRSPPAKTSAPAPAPKHENLEG